MIEAIKRWCRERRKARLRADAERPSVLNDPIEIASRAFERELVDRHIRRSNFTGRSA